MVLEPFRTGRLRMVVEKTTHRREAHVALGVFSQHVLQRVARRLPKRVAEVAQDVLKHIDVRPASRGSSE